MTAAMGRRKQTQTDLPPRLRLKHGAYYHVVREDGRERWYRLSADLAEAYRLTKQGRRARQVPGRAKETGAAGVPYFLADFLISTACWPAGGPTDWNQ